MTSARTLCQNLLKHVEALSEQIAELEKGLRMRQTGQGRFTFNNHSGGRSNLRHSVEALVPSAETFSKDRDLEDGDPSALRSVRYVRP